MQRLDHEFFEEYKRLERLCSDLYACKNGVSCYLSDMEAQERIGKRADPAWEDTYEDLRRLRWLRNKLAHDAVWGQLCTYKDLERMDAFHDAILSGEDPLTKLRKFQEKTLPQHGSGKKERHPPDPSGPRRRSRPTPVWRTLFFLYAAALLLAVFWLVYICFG